MHFLQNYTTVLMTTNMAVSAKIRTNKRIIYCSYH